MNTMSRLVVSSLVLVFLVSGAVFSAGENKTTLTLFDFEDGDIRWAIHQGSTNVGGATIITDTPDKSKYALELNPPAHCVICSVFDKSVWSEAAETCKEEDILQISFWIKGDNKMSDMVLVLVEEDGDQWIASVSSVNSEPVPDEWIEIVRVIKNKEMQTDFRYQPGSGKGESARKLNIDKMDNFQLTNYTENERHLVVDRMELRILEG